MGFMDLRRFNFLTNWYIVIPAIVIFLVEKIAHSMTVVLSTHSNSIVLLLTFSENYVQDLKPHKMQICMHIGTCTFMQFDTEKTNRT